MGYWVFSLAAVLLAALGGFVAGTSVIQRDVDTQDMRARVAEGMTKVREDQLERAVAALNDQAIIDQAVFKANAAGVRQEPWDKLDPFKPAWLFWLHSRASFQENGTTTVGHDALVAAINAVGDLLDENERLRGQEPAP